MEREVKIKSELPADRSQLKIQRKPRTKVGGKV